MGNIQNGRMDFSDLKYVKNDDSFLKFQLQRGDILFNRTNSIELVGKSAVYDSDIVAIFASYLIRIQCDPDLIVPSFLNWWINGPEGKEWARRVRTDGVSQSNINGKKLAALQFPLPPLAEQRRIVAQLEALLADVDRVRGRLEAVAGTMQRFRKAVLGAAMDGRLTEGWRRNRPVGNALALLDGCCKDREAQWEDAKQKRGSGLRKYPQPFVIETPIAPCPEGWTSATLSQIAFFDVGFAFKSEEFTDAGVRLLRGENIKPGSIDWEKARCISTDHCAEYAQFLLEERDIVLGMDRPIISSGLKLARVRKPDLPCLLVQRVMRFRFVKKEMREFIFLCLLHSAFADSIKHGGLTGSDLPHITGDTVPRFVIPLPPLPEQHEIVRRVDTLFALADRIEGEVAGARERVDTLTQAILAKAFRGELVPTEAELARREGREYEPAVAMLERMRAEGTVKTGSVKSSRKRLGAGTITLEAFEDQAGNEGEMSIDDEFSSES